ncbi:MAG: hypothetical protein MUF75_07870 [Bacteroidia bacterium]|jgi:hypothetical protein|nr:hypothetical protein [Bacteroidia bacterium]
MKASLYLVLFACIGFSVKAQVLSQFTWNSNPVTTAAVGPNATSVSGSAISSPGGVGGTNGLNAGLPTADINLTIPTGGGLFDVSGIDVSIDYQRDETVGSFFTRGSSLIITGAANLSVSYRVDNGAGGFNTVNSGNVYAIPSDNTFRTYRFVYLPTTGTGSLFVNGTSVWTNDGPDNRSMYWTGSGNIVIGALLDGASQNQTFLDNLIIGAVTSSPLPIELIRFGARAEFGNVWLDWATATEKNNAFFTIQRSRDGENWEALGEVKGAGNSRQIKEYSYVDTSPFYGTSYYRLKQTDFDGRFSLTPIRSVTLEKYKEPELHVYPNPTKSIIHIQSKTLKKEDVLFFDLLGKDCSAQCKFVLESPQGLLFDLSALETGVYYMYSPIGTIKLVKD